MRKKAIFTTLFFAASLMTAGAALAAEESKSGQEEKYGATDSRGTSQQDSMGAAGQEQESETAATSGSGAQQQSIQAADDLQKFTVRDSQGEELGQISQVLVNLESGQVGYAIVSSGGLLGMGEDKYIVPFSALKSGEGEQTLTLDIQKDQLKQAPKGDAQQVAADREKEREIHQFYGVSPYWEESGAQQEQQQMETQEEQSIDRQMDQIQQQDQMREREEQE